MCHRVCSVKPQSGTSSRGSGGKPLHGPTITVCPPGLGNGSPTAEGRGSLGNVLLRTTVAFLRSSACGRRQAGALQERPHSQLGLCRWREADFMEGGGSVGGSQTEA